MYPELEVTWLLSGRERAMVIEQEVADDSNLPGIKDAVVQAYTESRKAVLSAVGADSTHLLEDPTYIHVGPPTARGLGLAPAPHVTLFFRSNPPEDYSLSHVTLPVDANQTLTTGPHALTNRQISLITSVSKGRTPTRPAEVAMVMGKR